MRDKLLLITAAAGSAILINLILYAVGRAAGGTFSFTAPSGPAAVDAVTVAGFSAVPLLAGLVAVALLAHFGSWVTRTALVLGPVLAIGTIALMTLPTDLDTVSKVTLSLCHLALVPIIIAAVRRLGQRAEAPEHADAAVEMGPA